MKVLKQPLATRYNDLRLVVDCPNDGCGAQVEVDATYIHKSLKPGYRVSVTCPFCRKEIGVKLEDEQLEEYIQGL